MTDGGPRCWILLTEAQATELSVGRVPAAVQALAKTMVDHTFEELKQNARKPVTLARVERGATTPGTGSTAKSATGDVR